MGKIPDYGKWEQGRLGTVKEQYIIVGGGVGGKGAAAVETLELQRCKTVVFKTVFPPKSLNPYYSFHICRT